MQNLVPETGPINACSELGPDERLSLQAWIATLSVVIIPFIGFFAALAFFWGRGIQGQGLALLIVFYVLTVIGITVGFHRLFTHRSFETTPFVQGLLAILGSMAVQGPLLKWVAFHRRHHRFSDTEHDPHSPKQFGDSFMGALRGAWHSHMGWFFTVDPPDLSTYVRDLSKNKMLKKISDLFGLWVVLSLLIPTAIGFIGDGWKGAVIGFVWGGLARIFLVHHVTWSVNSVCHIWGSRPHNGRDQSRNNALFGLLALGEGWHNNHHAFPSSARHGLSWWQVDISYYVIYTLRFLGLAKNVRLPPKIKPIISAKPVL